MSPKTSLNLADRASEGEDERHHRLRRCREPPHHKADKHRRSKKKKKRSEKLKLNEEEANKSLYICHIEHHPGRWVAYVVRAINLSDLLLSSEDDDGLQLRQVGYKAGDELPGSVGCGVWGSRIVFAAGMKPCGRMPSFDRPDIVWHRDVYAFETDPNKHKQPRDNSRITKMGGTLVEAKFLPLMEEVGGKLYALSYTLVADPPSFEVFDPKVGSWAPLPQPPFFKRQGQYNRGGFLSYAVTGTKMFVSQERCPVFCFDVAHPDRGWRLVSSMCQRGPFPFENKALVLDLPAGADDKKKIMFAYSFVRWYLGVYLMSLEENQESITRIGDFKLPRLPQEYEFAQRCYFVHIGGQKACIVAPELVRPYKQGPDINEAGTHRTQGVAIPFQFEVDITKVDKDEKNCLTLQFMPTRIFEFYTNPSTFPDPEAEGWCLINTAICYKQPFACVQYSKGLNLCQQNNSVCRHCLSFVETFGSFCYKSYGLHVYLRTEARKIYNSGLV
ncbi:hypothetical protein ABKV19_027100 [Rosa sericea]